MLLTSSPCVLLIFLTWVEQNNHVSWINRWVCPKNRKQCSTLVYIYIYIYIYIYLYIYYIIYYIYIIYILYIIYIYIILYIHISYCHLICHFMAKTDLFFKGFSNIFSQRWLLTSHCCSQELDTSGFHKWVIPARWFVSWKIPIKNGS